MKEYIKNRVHELYWNDNINCARTVKTENFYGIIQRDIFAL